MGYVLVYDSDSGDELMSQMRNRRPESKVQVLHRYL